MLLKNMRWIIFIVCVGFVNASVLKMASSEGATQNKMVVSDQLSERYKKITWDDVVQPVKLSEQTRDLEIEDDLVNSNIKIFLTNNTAKTLNINAIAYEIKGSICGITKQRLVIEAGKAIAGFYVDKAESVKCLDQINPPKTSQTGHLTLIDVGSKFDIHKYQQYTGGLFLYPVTIKVYYSHKGADAIRTQTMYLIYTLI